MAASSSVPYPVWLALFLHLPPVSYWMPFPCFAGAGDDHPFNNTFLPHFYPPTGAPARPKSSNSALIVGICVTLAGVAIAAAGSCYFLWRRRGKRSRAQRSWRCSSDDNQDNRKRDVEDNDHRKLNLDSSSFGPRSFTYRQLSIATKDFSDTELLGHGGFGSVYKGSLFGTPVAVKRISGNSRQGLKEFLAEVTIISRIRHRHLVQLQGWCHEKGSLLLVYDYMPNGSLDRFLFSDEAEAEPLTWAKRYAILCGLGAALQYLHEECEKLVIHRDVKSSNVMLDAKFTAKLGDFGLARQVEQEGAETATHTTKVAGTLGYMAPECYETGKATRETDVFSFGAVLLEVATGKRPWSNGGGKLVEWVWGLFGEERLLEAADPRLRSSFEEAELRRVLVVGLACSHPAPKSRPSIREAVLALQGTSPLPFLPPHRPIAFYFAAPPPPLSISELLSTTSTKSSSNAAVPPKSSSFDNANLDLPAVLLPR